MPACPNCGRKTMRTRDWACQWCGYPLLSRSYKKIDKTFKELQGERYSVLKAFSPELEPELETLEPEPPPEPAPQPPPVIKKKVKPPPRLVEKPRPPAPPPLRPELQPEAELPPAPPHPPPLVSPAPPPILISEPALPPPPPAPEVAPPSLDKVTEGALLTVDELDALYRVNRLTAHARLAGKTIVVKGFVEKVFIRDHIDVRYIMLTGAGRNVTWPVRCTFAKESVSQMGRLSEGQEVTLRGKYDGYGKNIIFKDCVLS